MTPEAAAGSVRGRIASFQVFQSKVLSLKFVL
jgi:hypothetical protein